MPSSFISIHPPRVGRDEGDMYLIIELLISIHPPRVGRDQGVPLLGHGQRRFQSTLPVWGGTARILRGMKLWVISIHPPRVGRDSKSSQKFFVNFCARR